jgi:hypothetical protein
VIKVFALATYAQDDSKDNDDETRQCRRWRDTQERCRTATGVGEYAFSLLLLSFGGDEFTVRGDGDQRKSSVVWRRASTDSPRDLQGCGNPRVYSSAPETATCKQSQTQLGRQILETSHRCLIACVYCTPLSFPVYNTLPPRPSRLSTHHHPLYGRVNEALDAPTRRHPPSYHQQPQLADSAILNEHELSGTRRTAMAQWAISRTRTRPGYTLARPSSRPCKIQVEYYAGTNLASRTIGTCAEPISVRPATLRSRP